MAKLKARQRADLPAKDFGLPEKARSAVAGPTLRHFDELDDPGEADILIWEGLGLTQIVIAPHVDNPEFGAGCRKAGDLCEREGYTVQRLGDSEAFVIDGDREWTIGP